MTIDASAVGAAAASGSGAQAERTLKMCSAPVSTGYAQCLSELVVTPPSSGSRTAAVTPRGLTPDDLLSAYNLPANGGKGATIAIVDAFDDPNAAEDLAVYRAQFGLPALAPGQFRKVNQSGEEGNYPVPDAEWAGEISLDLDMVSAIAPYANILLVETDTNSFDNLGAGVDRAVALGATAVSNSYGAPEQDPSREGEIARHYDHPGVPITVSAGDSGYGVQSPANLPTVTSVGGTSLVKDSSTARGWSESVWFNSHGGTGSGCSQYQQKPAFQKDTGCEHRTVADVSAVADPVTGVAVYDSYGGAVPGGWGQFGGTSASAPIIAGVYSLAGRAVSGQYPNTYPYANADSLNDVTTGADGACTPEYLCSAQKGYDGPTGLGTPDGLKAFTAAARGEVSGTVTDADTHKAIKNAKVTIGSLSVRTDNSGQYDVTVLPGTYNVSADEYAYLHMSVSGVVVGQDQHVTRDFALKPAPMTTVKGTVTDGSGHGWPLYASIDVDEGIPSGAVQSDPRSGRFTVSVPRNGAHTLHVASEYAGYIPQNADITVGSSPVVRDVRLTADPAPAEDVAAPGYTLRSTDYSQSFDGPGLPDGWHVDTTAGSGWSVDTTPIDPGLGGTPLIKGGYASISSSPLTPAESTLTSAAIKVNNTGRQVLAFDEQQLLGRATIDVSADNGATWTNVFTDVGRIVSPTHRETPLPDSVRGQTVRFRLKYSADQNGFPVGQGWIVDNLQVVTKELRLVPGGLVVGVTRDANTKAALNDVTLDMSGAASQKAYSGPLGSGKQLQGYYVAFVPGSGTVKLTASLFPYTNTTKRISVAKNRLIDGDIDVAVGRLAVKPAAVSAITAPGHSVHQDITVTNTGSAPVTVAVGETDAATTHPKVTAIPKTLPTPSTDLRSQLAAARKLRAKGPLSAKAARRLAATPPMHAASSPSPQGSIADLPGAVMYNLAETDPKSGSVYSGFGLNSQGFASDSFGAYNPSTDTWTAKASPLKGTADAAHAFIGGKLYVTGGFNFMDPSLFIATTQVYTPATDTWSTASDNPAPTVGSGSAVLKGKLYIVSGIDTQQELTSRVEVYDPDTDTWTQAGDYPIPAQDLSCGTAAGVLYCAGGGTPFPQQKVFAYDPATDKWTAKADLPRGLLGAASTVADGKLLLAGGVTYSADGTQVVTNQALAYDPAADRWTPLPNLGTPRAWAAGALGFYVLGGGTDSAELIPGHNRTEPTDLPWLAESKKLITIAPGQHTTLRLEFSPEKVPGSNGQAAVTGGLTFTTNSPYVTGDLPVTLTVRQPAGCGHQHHC
ncbi:kelch repeat-containing protein (plasmid) [Streptomyces sp. AHU1]|uniref:kelch repeat-containing protein n=1 Tax=Streptomyces sp. AHU1 TaxID=3377215 RepID=UPI003877D07F